MPLLLATANPHKVEEMQAIFAALLPDLRLLSLADLPGGPPPEPAETGTTFEANATIKARAYGVASGMACLADDSGLEIDALQGRPGVISSHYCTDGQETGMTRAQRDQANNQRVLRELEGVAPEDRTARFVCTMALAFGGGAFQAPPTPSLSPLSAKSALQSPVRKSHTDSLPHWEQAGATYSLTFCTLDSDLSPQERQIVLDACMHWHATRAHVEVVVVMPDHVHLVVRPLQQPDGAWPSIPWLMQSIKTFTAREINRVRGRSGTLWQDEYFDRIVRRDGELEDIVHYIGENPVRKGLASTWSEYPFIEGARPKEWKRRRGLEGPAPAPVLLVRGTFEGRIGLPTEVPRGSHGFGYDPLFLVAPAFTHTGAELDPSEKNRLSHRAAAAGQMAAKIRALLATDPAAFQSRA
ncbi:MAG TPA: non-canonical purine NTP pyrophosphatase [Phycisphaerales bacterium]